MDKSGANIDFVFRNGLKDYEVLPPCEVWDSIHPVIRKKQRPAILMRAAALAAVIISLSFFAYRWSLNLTDELDRSVIAFNIGAEAPIYRNLSAPVDISSVSSENRIIERRNLYEEVEPVLNTTIPEEEILSSPSVSYIGKSYDFSDKAIQSLQRSPVAELNSGNKKSYSFTELNDPYYTENSMKGKQKWSLGAMASPTYYSRFGAGSDEISGQMKAAEQAIVSYTGGVAFSYKLNKRFSIQSGLYYSSLGQEVEGINSFGGFQKYDFAKGDRNFEVLTTSGTVYTNNSDVFLIADGPGDRVLTNITRDIFDPGKANLQYIDNSLLQNFNYLELPIILRYKLIDKTLGVNLIGGVSYNMLVGNSVYAVVDGGKYQVGETEGLNPISLSSSLGMGMEYSFSKNFSLNFEPTFRYYLNPFNEVSGSNAHPYSFGIFSGVTYKF